MTLDDDKRVDNTISCKNILQLANAHNGQTALHEAVKVNADMCVSSNSLLSTTGE